MTLQADSRVTDLDDNSPFQAQDGRYIYVSKSGNDTTGNGSSGAPYLTVKAAVNSATGASKYSPFLVMIGPGQYEEAADFVLKDYVYLEGTSRDEETLVFRSDSSKILWAANDVAGDIVFMHLRNLYLTSGIEAVRPTGSVEESNLVLENCFVTSGFNFQGSGSGFDNYTMRNCSVQTASHTVKSGQGTYENCTNLRTTIDDQGVDATAPSFVTFIRTNHTRLDLADFAQAVLIDSPFTFSTAFLVGADCALTVDAVSAPTSALNLSGGATAAQVSNTSMFKQIGLTAIPAATDLAYWDTSLPTDADDALERSFRGLAALSPGGKIPL